MIFFHLPAWPDGVESSVLRHNSVFLFLSVDHTQNPARLSSKRVPSELWLFIFLYLQNGFFRIGVDICICIYTTDSIKIEWCVSNGLFLLQPNKQSITFYSWKAIGERKCWLILQYLIDTIKRKCLNTKKRGIWYFAKYL